MRSPCRYFYFLFLLYVLVLNCPGKREEKAIEHHRTPVITIEPVKLKRNSHLQAALFKTTLDQSFSLRLIDLLKTSKFPFRYCQPCDSIYIIRKNGEFQQFCYVKSPKEKFIIESDSCGLKCYMFFPYLEYHQVVIAGRINSSLYETMISMGETPELVYKFADIFAWEIDFFTETQDGDSFEVLVEKELAYSRVIGYTKILYVRYKGLIGDYKGIYFDDPEGYDDFYNLYGESLRKSLLKSPLRYSRISSFFSHRRMHPILRIYRPHHGIDYVAPAGTPVSSIGEGRVTFMGWKGGYGRLVEIRHPNNYKTRYGHLSRYASGLKPGKHIKMGEVIGYVGSSGLATGPHLHFEFHINNRPSNPLKIKIPRAPSVKEKYRPMFEKEKNEILKMVQILKKATIL